MTPTIACRCRNCGVEFQCLAHLHRRGQGKYCSRICSCAHGAKARKEQAARLRSNGSLLVDAIQRLHTKSEPDLNTGCLLWAGSVNHSGYGLISVAGKLRLAHRFAYEVASGSIPAGLMVCHKCDTPGCINPEHMFLGTARDNNRDRDAKGRSRAPMGERSATAVLTEQQVTEARLARLTPNEVAKRFDICQSGATQALRGSTWAHLDAPTVDNQRRSKNGVTGLVFRPRRAKPWQANYFVDRKPRHIGYFSDREDAVAAIIKARRDAGQPPPYIGEPKGDPYRREEDAARRERLGIWR